MSSKRVATLLASLWLVAGCGGGTGLGGGNNNNTTCGDGLLGPGEACDGDELAGLTCEAMGYAGGTLACTASCELDESGCVLPGPCGDGLVDVGEACDLDNLDGATCETLGYDGGTLACAADCQLDPEGCTLDSCGDGVIEGIEECDDGNAVAGDGCGAGCAVEEGWECAGEPSVCTPIQTCGNGTVDADEDCDGADLNSTSCQDLGWDGGTLACLGDCTFDESGCTVSTCGNGAVDTGEQCDGADLDGETCQSQGFDYGTLACAGDCTFDTSQCAMASCGDGVVQSGEQCDSNNLNGESCSTLGYSGGALACTGTCTFDVSGCTGTAVCGNGQIEAGEECDGANLGGQSCQTLGFGGGTLTCAGTCDFDTSGCTAPACSPTGGALACGASEAEDTSTNPAATDAVDAWTGTGCMNWPMTGPEVVYTYNPGSADETIQATLTGLSNDLDLILIEDAGTGCDAGLTCLQWSYNGGNQDESISFTALANTDYFLVVDGYNNAQGPYQLDLMCVQPLRQIYELFTWNAGDTWDLAGTTITFTPDSTAPNGYAWAAATGVTAFPTPLSAAALQVPFAAEDDTYEHSFGGAQTFTFFGVGYSSVWVNTHATVSFGVGDTSYDETGAAFTAGPPRVAGEWDRVNVLDANGGRVWVQQLNDRVAITWDSVADYFGYADHALQIELFFSGQIAITNLQAGGDDGLCGITEGGGGTDPGEVNFVP